MKRDIAAVAGLLVLSGCGMERIDIRPAGVAQTATSPAERAYQEGKADLAGGRPGLAIVAFETALANDPGSVKVPSVGDTQVTGHRTVDAVLKTCEYDLVTGVGTCVVRELPRVGDQDSAALRKHRSHHNTGVRDHADSAALESLWNSLVCDDCQRASAGAGVERHLATSTSQRGLQIAQLLR